jgi:molecular chaperone DnaJ
MAFGFDPYAVLGVSRDASAAQIAHARRRLSRQYHPDVNGAPDAAARFDEVQRAFNLLSDPAARAEYDRAGDQPGGPRKAGATTSAARGIVAQPASVNFGRLGPGRPVADATVSVTWTGARPSRITSDPGSEWWAIVGSASSVSSSVVVFHLRAEARAGMPGGQRHDQFTVHLDGRSMSVPLTAEFSSVPRPPATATGTGTGTRTARAARSALGWRLAVVALFVTAVIARVIFVNVAHSGGGQSAGGGQATASAPVQPAQVAALPPAPVRVPQATEAAISVRPLFTPSRPAADKATERSAGMAGPPVQQGLEVLLPVATSSDFAARLQGFCVTVAVPKSSDAGGTAGSGKTFTEHALSTVTARGGTDLVFPAVLPGSYALDPNCSPDAAGPVPLGTVAVGNLGVVDGATDSDPGSATVVFATRTSGATTTVTYGAIGQAPSLTPPADDSCVASGLATSQPAYRQPVQSLVSQHVTGADEWLETGTLVFRGIVATSQQGYFHYNCTAGIADGEPGIAVP